MTSIPKKPISKTDTIIFSLGETDMKKIFSLFIALTLLAFVASPALATKPDSKDNGAKFYNWYLSSSVMPVPPYGSADVIGSDTASKLIVNQPNGKVKTMLTGAMKSLKPLTIYTVYLSKGYTPYEITENWNVTGIHKISLTIGSTPYTEYLKLEQSGNTLTGSLALDEAQTQSKWNIDTATINGEIVEIYAHFGSNTNMKLVMNGTISSDGTISGNWHDIDWNTRSGNWSTSSGAAKKIVTGDTTWPGLIAGVNPFTFTTDEFGSGSWHYNFKDESPEELSVWINGAGGTILISDSIKL